MSMLALTAELCGIFARDESENANIAATNSIKRSFGAEEAALFYITGQKVFRVCVSGTDFPIALPEKRWRDCVESHMGGMSVSRFGAWAIPAIGKPLASWISVCLYMSGDEGGYVFLGRDSGSWSDRDEQSLDSIRSAIAPIVQVRHERGIEEHRRKEAETLLAKNESRLRDLFEGSREMIYTADDQDLITGANAAAVKLLGLSSKAAIIGRPFADFAMAPLERKLFLDKIAKHGYVDEHEIVLVRKGGEPVFCLETAHALKDESGAVRELQGIVKDISGRIENEKKLWKMNLELAEANLKLQKSQALMVQQEKLASIGQLAAGVAHEINNPLGFLISNNAMLERYFGSIRAAIAELAPDRERSAPKASAKLERTFSEAESIFAESGEGFGRIVKIVGGLKNFSRVDSSGTYSEYDLNAGVESSLVVAWNEIKFVAEVRRDLRDIPRIRANGGEINQVVLNILVNAAQAIGGTGRDGKGLIEIATRATDETVLLSIKDDGPGIPEAARNKIFDPFFTTKEPGKGTGLGLSISYDIVVAKHGGTIWVESERGAGTTFYISLPIAGPPSGTGA